MKTSALLLVVALRAVVASELTDVLSQFPDCSLECIAAGAESFDCDLTDLDCQCGQMEGITAEVSPCMVEAGCEFEDITNVAGIVSKLCADKLTGNISSTNEAESDDDEVNQDDKNTAARLQEASLLSALIIAAFVAVL